MSGLYYVGADGNASAKISLAEAAGLAASGTLGPKTLVWTDDEGVGMAEWAPLGDCAAFFPQVVERLAPGEKRADSSAISPKLSGSPRSLRQSEGAATTPVEGRQLHVRGIGVDGWDGTTEGFGTYESEEALRKIFSEFGEFEQATIRHRITGGQNTSWALVTMGDVAAVEKALAAPSVMAGSTRLVLNRFDKKTAAASRGQMKKVQERDKELRRVGLSSGVKSAVAMRAKLAKQKKLEVIVASAQQAEAAALKEANAAFKQKQHEQQQVGVHTPIPEREPDREPTAAPVNDVAEIHRLKQLVNDKTLEIVKLRADLDSLRDDTATQLADTKQKYEQAQHEAIPVRRCRPGAEWRGP